eukprot:tig00020875_g14885.t1
MAAGPKQAAMQYGLATYTWGQGTLGQLGHGDDADLAEPRLLLAMLGRQIGMIACGNQHTCLLTSDGQVFTFGRGNFGQLGLGTTIMAGSQPTPRQIVAMQGKRCTALGCGWYHTALLTDTGELWMCGAGEYGRLGLGDETNQAEPVLLKALQGKDVVSVSCGGFHSVALTRTGAVYSWGGGYFGQLGHGDDRERRTPRLVKALKGTVVTQIACGTHHTCVITDKGALWTWGSGEFGKLGHGDDKSRPAPGVVESLRGRRIRFVTAGGFHTACITEEGALLTWGCGDKGQLGHGDRKDKWMPRPVEALARARIRALACGTHHTAAATEAGELFVWGSGEFGRLGIGDQGEQGVAQPVLVESLKGQKVIAVECGSFHTVAVVAEVPKEIPDEDPKKAAMSYPQAAQAAAGTKGGKGAGLLLKGHANDAVLGAGDLSNPEKARMMEEEIASLRRQLNRARMELGQRTEDCERLQMEISRLEGADTAYLSVEGLEELERTYYEGLQRVSMAKSRALAADMDAKADDLAQEIEKLARDQAALEGRTADEAREIRQAIVALKQDMSRLRLSLLRRSTTTEQAVSELDGRTSMVEAVVVQLRDFLKLQFAAQWQHVRLEEGN